MIVITDNVDIMELIESRRSVRSFTKKGIANEDVFEILKAGVWAPTPSNVQSWRFGVVEEEGELDILKNLSPGFPESAPLGIVVCSSNKDISDFGGEELVFLRSAELAMAVQNMLLAAWDKEIGTCTVASFSEGGIAELLDLPDSIEPVLLVAVGYPETVPEPPERKDLEEITFWGSYD